MKRCLFTIIILAAAVSFPEYNAAANDQVPGAAQQEPVALVGGTVHPVSGGVIETGTVVFDKGIITVVGVNAVVPAGARRIDVTGLHVYPGLIESVSRLGLTEINSVRATVDYVETGTINPNVRAETAVNPDSERIPVTRANGIAVAATLPDGGLVSGNAAVLMLDGWTWEAMTLKACAGLVINWPAMRYTGAYGMQSARNNAREETKKNLEVLEQAFTEAEAYLAAKGALGKPDAHVPETDLRWEAMIPVLRGEEPVWVIASRAEEIISAVEFCDRHGLKMVLFGGADAPEVADLLVRKEIPVVAVPILELPARRHDPYDLQYTLPVRLFEAGVTCVIAGGTGYGNERNLPYHAGMAAAFGLPKEEALKAVTLNAARILGVGDRIGSIEPGKDATLIVTTGDPLEIATSVEMMFIQGRTVDLSNRQTELYEKYLLKYSQEDAGVIHK